MLVMALPDDLMSKVKITVEPLFAMHGVAQQPTTVTCVGVTSVEPAHNTQMYVTTRSNVQKKALVSRTLTTVLLWGNAIVWGQS